MKGPLAPWAVFLGVFVVLAATTRPMRGGDGVPHRYLPLSVLCEGDLDLDELPFTREPDGRVAPRPYYLAEGRGGRLVSTFGPWPGLLATPVFAVARWVDPVFRYERVLSLGCLAACLMSAAAAGWMVRAATPLVGRRRAVLLELLFAFGTSVWSVMSPALWQHSASVPLLVAGLGALTRADGRCDWAGLWFGLSTLCRPSNLALAVAATAWVALHRRARLPAFLAWALPAVVLLLAYGAWAFGEPLSLGQAEVARSIAAHKGAETVWSIGPARVLAGTAGLLLSPSRGLFVFSPVLLFGLAGLLGSLRSGGSSLLRWLLVGGVGVIGVHAMRFDWWGGWSYGYRQLLDVVPLLVLGMAPLLGRLTAPGWPRGLFVASALASVWVQVVGVVAYDVVGWNAAPDVDQHPERLWSIADSQLLFYLADPRPPPPPQIWEFPPWTVSVCPVQVTGLEL